MKFAVFNPGRVIEAGPYAVTETELLRPRRVASAV
jgi:hypothetical protein